MVDTQHVIEQFGSDTAQEAYVENAKEGLWPSEQVVIEIYFDEGEKVLDLGCGTGRTTFPLIEEGYDVVGVDVTPEMIENAKEVAKELDVEADFRVGDATDLEFDDESFGNILFSNVGWTQIPGRENRLKALEEIYRVLKPGGVYIHTTHVRTLKGFFWVWAKQWLKLKILKPLGFDIPEEEFGDRFFTDESGKKLYDKPQYIHIPDVEDVRAQIEEVGFEVIYMKRANEVTPESEHDFSPMFYVCKKKVEEKES